MYTCYKYFIIFASYLLRNIRQRKTLIIALSIIIFSTTLYFNSDHFPDLLFVNTEPYQNVSCHYVTKGDALRQIDERFLPATNSIFFHETSCRGRLNSRQACSIESAARIHPNWQIHVLFSAPVYKLNLRDTDLELLKLLRNVFFARVHIVDYAKRTPLEKFVAGGALNRTRWGVTYTSDVLRYLTLYKWGGVYLDMDMVVVKSLEDLGKNWAAREDANVISARALAFHRYSLGTFITDALVRKFAKTFRGDVWRQDGPLVITEVMKTICTTKNVTQMNAGTCIGIEIFPRALFYPLNSNGAERFLQPGDLNFSTEAYTYNLWNQITHKLNVSVDSPYAKLAKRFCPIVYDIYRNRFGV